MIVTFDSGILVRAAGWPLGPAFRAVDSVAFGGAHVLALSEYILGEVGKVLAYARIQARMEITGDEIHAYVARLRLVSRLVNPTAGRPVVLSDPGDDPVVYTAVAARADILCALDRHFYDPNVVRFCGDRGIAVMDDISLLRVIRSV